MDVGHQSASASPQTATEDDPAPPDALGAPIILNNAPESPRSTLRWRPEELFASETARGGLAGQAVVPVILGMVGLVASAVAIMFHNLFAYSFSLRESQEHSPVETTTNAQSPPLTNPRRRPYLQSHVAESSYSESTGNLPLRSDDSRKFAGAPLMSRAPSTSTDVSKGSLHGGTASSGAVDMSRPGTPDPGGCAQCSKPQCAEFGCRHAAVPSAPAGSTTNNAAAIGGGGASDSSSVPPATARSESLPGRNTHIAAICSHNRACATASGGGGVMTTSCSPSHSQAADTTLVGDMYEFGHECPGVLRHTLAPYHNGLAKGDAEKDKGRKMGGFRRIREAFRRNTPLISRAPSNADAAVTSDDGWCSSSDHRRYHYTEGARGRVVSGKSDDSVGATDSPQRKPAALPLPLAPLPPSSGPAQPPPVPDSLPLIPISFPDQLPYSSPSSTSPHVSVSSSPETLTSMSYPSVVVTPSALTSSPAAPNPQPRSSVPAFHCPNILKRPSSPLCPPPSPSSRTLTLPPPGALRRSAATNVNVSAGARQGKVKKCGKKTKPPPLRTAYTYTFAPASTFSPEEEDLHSDSREVSDVEGNARGQRIHWADDDVGGEEPSAQRRSFSLNPDAGTSRSRPRTASGDDQLHQSRQRRSNGMKRSTMTPDNVVPIFVPLAPRVAGSLPTGVSVVNPSVSGCATLPVPVSAPPAQSQSGYPIQGGLDASASVGSYARSAATTLPVVGDVASAGLGATGIDEFGRKVCRRSMPPPPGVRTLVASSLPPHMHMDSGALVPASPTTSDLEPERAKDKRKVHRRFSLR